MVLNIIHTTVLAKILEVLMLDQMRYLFQGAGIPHINQSLYQNRLSCAEAIFATQEA